MFGKTGYILIAIFVILILIPFILIQGPFWRRAGSPLLIKVYNHQQDEIVTMELEDYLRGVVAAEMPALYKLEALKAQAVAARTYTLRQLPEFGGQGSQEHPDADICTDYNHSQAWLSESEMKERWGFLPFFYYWARINKAVEETEEEVLFYEGELIDAVYHANSGGVTEDAVNVWGRKTPYLVSVISPYDKESEKNYLSSINLSLTEIIKKMGLDGEEGLDLSAEGSDEMIRIIESSKSGRVLEVMVGGEVFSGRELRQKLNLPSTMFEIKNQGELVSFTIYGKGHGVGMSQDGANGYAGRGLNYKEILEHYYPGTTLGRVR